MQKVATRDVRDFGRAIAHEARFATPTDSPRHDGSAYSHVHVRRERVGFVHRSRVIFCRPVPKSLTYDSQLFSIAVRLLRL
jgi:hypothetical protein